MSYPLGIYDTETNGLKDPKRNAAGIIIEPAMDRMHTLTLIIPAYTDERGIAHLRRQISACDHPEYKPLAEAHGWEWMPLIDGLKLLSEARVRVAHNGADFDEGDCEFNPGAIQIAFPWWKPLPGSKLLDTLLLSRLLYPDIARSGPNSHKLPPHARNRHALREWGIRLGVHKGDYKGGWLEWSPEMQDYGEQDTVVLERLFNWLMAQQPTPQSSAIEHEFAAIIRRQERRGFGFDHEKAARLQGELVERQVALEADLIVAFGEWWAFGKAANAGASRPETYDPDDDEDAEDEEEQDRRRLEWKARMTWGDVVIPTKDRSTKMVGFPDVTVPRTSPLTGKPLKPYVGPPKVTYSQGAAYTPIKRVQFNPRSRAHVRQRLSAKYGWEPSRFTKGGKHSPPVPVVDDDVVRGLPYPEAQMLADYYLVTKRLGQVSEGKQAWMRTAREEPDQGGRIHYRIHGRVNTNGAVTARCTHMSPNLAQVPKNTSAFKLCPQYEEVQGWRCRELFIAIEPYVLQGFDGSSLEGCMAAHYLSKWDKGEYAKVVSEGDKAKGTDPHSWMRSVVIGEDIIGAGDPGRDNAKTAFYASLYGSGDEKLGSIVLPTAPLREKRELGKLIKHKIFGAWEAMASLKWALEQAVEERGYLVALDGRKLKVRKRHAALNTLLQSAGAIVMKRALIELDTDLRVIAGLQPGRDYEFVANIHDEAQAEVLPDHTPEFARHALQALPKAGQFLRVQCPLKAEVSPAAGHGPAYSWRETH